MTAASFAHRGTWPPMVFSASVLAAVFLWVDLTPKVEAEFFFSRDDPQYVASAEIADRFPTSQQIKLWQPIVGAAFIVSAGFGIFGLSTFPPTQKFGLAVILGTVVAAATALLVLPYGAAAGSAEGDLA